MRLPQPQQIVVQRVPCDLVERRERLVEQQQIGFGDEGARDRDAHPHAARQLARIGVLEPGEADRAQRLGDPVALGRADPPGDAERQLDIARDGAPRHQRRVLKDEADAAGRDAASSLGAAEMQRAASGRRLAETGDDAQQRALAAAGRTQQAQELAARTVRSTPSSACNPDAKRFPTRCTTTIGTLAGF